MNVAHGPFIGPGPHCVMLLSDSGADVPLEQINGAPAHQLVSVDNDSSLETGEALVRMFANVPVLEANLSDF